MSRLAIAGTPAAPAVSSPLQALRATARTRDHQEEATMAKALIWAVVIIFLIGLAVVVGVFDFIF